MTTREPLRENDPIRTMGFFVFPGRLSRPAAAPAAKQDPTVPSAGKKEETSWKLFHL